MEDLVGMAIFARVVQAKSFSAAAQQTGLSASAISKHISQLEQRLNTRLLNRSTRQLSLTEAGSVFYQHCARMIDAAAAAEQALTQLQAEPRGILKLAVPIAFGITHITPLLPELLQNYPGLRVELNLSDQHIDSIAGGHDLVIATSATLADSSLQARRLASYQEVLCATPMYLARFGKPAGFNDLLNHQCLSLKQERSELEWHFVDQQQQPHSISVKPRLLANNSLLLRELVLNDGGIAALPLYLVAEDLSAGRLQTLLPEYQSELSAIYALYPQNRYLAPKVRVFIDFCAERFQHKTQWCEE